MEIEKVNTFIGQFSIHFENETKDIGFTPVSKNSKIFVKVLSDSVKVFEGWLPAERMSGSSRVNLVGKKTMNRIHSMINPKIITSVEISSIKGEWSIY